VHSSSCVFCNIYLAWGLLVNKNILQVIYKIFPILLVGCCSS